MSGSVCACVALSVVGKRGGKRVYNKRAERCVCVCVLKYVFELSVIARSSCKRSHSRRCAVSVIESERFERKTESTWVFKVYEYCCRSAFVVCESVLSTVQVQILHTGVCECVCLCGVCAVCAQFMAHILTYRLTEETAHLLHTHTHTRSYDIRLWVMGDN